MSETQTYNFGKRMNVLDIEVFKKPLRADRLCIKKYAFGIGACNLQLNQIGSQYGCISIQL